MLFRNLTNHKNLFIKPVLNENIATALAGIERLKEAGFTIKAVVIDCQIGLAYELIKQFPVQICQYHQIMIAQRYTTKSPRLQAGKELLELAKSLPRYRRETFELQLHAWHTKWKDFLLERSTLEDGRITFTHKRLRQAYRSLITHIGFLFTYQQYEELDSV